MSNATIDRVERMAAAYRSGRTLEEIGAMEGVTREWVRQLLERVGITGVDGGAAVRARSKNALIGQIRCERREARCREQYGCSWAEYVALTGAPRLYSTNSVSVATRIKHIYPLLGLFIGHSTSASKSRIPWKFTLPAYAKLIAPHIGKAWRQERLVLGRKKKSGPFSPDNAKVTSLKENSFVTRTGAISRQRMHKVLAMRAAGLSVPEIAKRTKLSLDTVKGYIYKDQNESIAA